MQGYDGTAGPDTAALCIAPRAAAASSSSKDKNPACLLQLSSVPRSQDKEEDCLSEIGTPASSSQRVLMSATASAHAHYLVPSKQSTGQRHSIFGSTIQNAAAV